MLVVDARPEVAEGDPGRLAAPAAVDELAPSGSMRRIASMVRGASGSQRAVKCRSPPSDRQVAHRRRIAWPRLGRPSPPTCWTPELARPRRASRCGCCAPRRTARAVVGEAMTDADGRIRDLLGARRSRRRVPAGIRRLDEGGTFFTGRRWTSGSRTPPGAITSRSCGRRWLTTYRGRRPCSRRATRSGRSSDRPARRTPAFPAAAPLFEGGPRFLARLAAARPFGDAEACSGPPGRSPGRCRRTGQGELIDAHPRLGPLRIGLRVSLRAGLRP